MAEPVVLDSRVREVSVFRSGAVVTRMAEMKPNGAWPDEIAFVGLPLAIDDESVRVSVVGPSGAKLPRPADVRVDLVVPAIGESLVPPDEKELRAAADEVMRLREVILRVDREVGRLDQIGLALPDPFENRPPKPAPAAAWRGVIDWKTRWKRERAEERRRLSDELMRAEEHLARLKRRLDELRASQDQREQHVSKRVRLRLRDAGETVAAVVRLEYRVPGARWVPTYVFRMGRDGKTAQLAVKALVVQSSGEPWERVKLAVSTADLLRDNELPELKSLRIGRRQPEPPKRAYREPPSGLDALFEGIDNALATSDEPPPDAPPPPPDTGASAIEADIEDVLGGLAQTEGGAFGGRGAGAGAMANGTTTRAADKSIADGRASGKKEAKEKAMRRESPPVNRPAPPPPPKMAGPQAQRAPGAPPRPMPAPSMPMPASIATSTPVAAAAPMQPMEPMPEMSKMDRASMADMPMDMDAEEEPMERSGFGGGAKGGKRGLARRLEPPRPGTLKFSDLVMAGLDDGGVRGRLRPATIADRLAGIDGSHAPGVAARLSEAESRAYQAQYVSFPGDTQDVGSSSGSYDHKYDAEGLVDVPGDGRIHAVPLLARTAPVATTLVVVPRESTQAVRVAEMRNPLDAPLLAGPAEIYLDDEYLVTSPIRTVPAGADLKVGLGIEEALKVARNTHFEEEATGLLGGGALLHHKIEIELANRLPGPVKIDVRERVPIKNEEDKDVEITIPAPTPAWEEFEQEDTSRIKGGKRWRMSLAAGESKKIFWTYTLKIDSKNEVVGGNRRE